MIKRTSKFIIAAASLLLLITSCAKNHEPLKRDEFFAWMDAYLAVEKNVENSVAITLFFEHAPYDPDDIARISFVGIADQVVIDDFKVEITKLPDQKYSSYGITLNYTANENGLYQTPGVIVSLKSNKEIKYPIGNWTFDIGDSDNEKVNTWDAPIATANGESFPYKYSFENKDARVNRIFYGNNLFIEDEHGLSMSGVINLKDHYSSPIVYIKSKMTFNEAGKEFISYGKGCYCGAVNFSEDVLEKSKVHNSLK